MKNGFPLAVAGQSVGIFGGTFDPPHAGHLLAAKRALRRVGLDQIWWVPSPGNPLKSRQPAPLQDRIDLIHSMIDDPKMQATDLEARLGTRYTIDTLKALQSMYVGVNFVMISGADILVELHRWRRWKELVKMVPICAVARPDDQLRAGLSPFAQTFARYRLEPEDAPLLKRGDAPAWVLLPGPMSELSSSAIRARHGTE